MKQNKYSIFHIEGGLGKHVAATAVARAIKKNHPERDLIVVCAYPEIFINLDFISRVYDFFEVERYIHDFSNIQQVTHEDDKVHGIFGDHKIRQEVKPLKSEAKEILGANVCNWIKNNYKWFYDEFRYF
jgi:hypothetical protein